MNNWFVIAVLFFEALLVAFIIGVVAYSWWSDQEPGRKFTLWSSSKEAAQSHNSPSP